MRCYRSQMATLGASCFSICCQQRHLWQCTCLCSQKSAFNVLTHTRTICSATAEFLVPYLHNICGGFHFIQSAFYCCIVWKGTKHNIHSAWKILVTCKWLYLQYTNFIHCRFKSRVDQVKFANDLVCYWCLATTHGACYIFLFFQQMQRDAVYTRKLIGSKVLLGNMV